MLTGSGPFPQRTPITSRTEAASMSSDTLLIIGGGPAGLAAARGAADLGCKTILVERLPRLGGTPISANYAALTHGMRDASEVMGEMIAAVDGDTLVDILLTNSVK